MGVASDCEIGGVGRLMMFGVVVVGMVMVAVVRVVEIVIFLFKFAYFHFTLHQTLLHSYTSFYRL